MSRIFIVSLLVIGAVGLSRAQAGAPTEAEIRDLVRRYVAARDARDANAIARLFTADADQLVSTGEWRRGREAVVKGTLASSAANSGSRSIVIDTVRFISDDVALADGPYAISGAAGGDTRRMWTSFVMVRHDRTWRIASIRNMLPAPNAAPVPAGR